MAGVNNTLRFPQDINFPPFPHPVDLLLVAVVVGELSPVRGLRERLPAALRHLVRAGRAGDVFRGGPCKDKTLD